MSETELMPCPFCGSPARTFKWEAKVTGKEFFRTACDADNPPGCDVEPFVDGDTEADAIAAWNRRSPVAEGGGWLPIDSAPKDVVCDFWMDWADDCATLNKPMTADNPDRWFRGRFGCWGSLYKATHWRPRPSPPVPSHLSPRN